MEQTPCPLCSSPSSRGFGSCFFCGVEGEGYKCINGHFTCLTCLETKSPEEALIRICMLKPSRDLVELADRCMLHPSIPMHGPEHHYLTSCVVLGWLKALGLRVTEGMMRAAVKRSIVVPGGSCGSMGLCGAPVGVGAALAVILKSTPLKPKERTTCINAVRMGLELVEEIDGVRCCKASTYSALMVASKVVKQVLGVGEVLSSVRCSFSNKNPDCLGSKCPFHPKQ